MPDENSRFLARQGLSFHGDGAQDSSNFNQLLHLRPLDDPNLLTWVQRKTEKYTSPEIQNELLKTMAQCVTRDIAAICLRNIDDNFDAHEDFVGIYAVESIKADILVQY